MNDPATQLAEARVAWRDLGLAESNLSRMKQYPRMTAGMKDDAARYQRMVSEARTTLNRILREAP